MWIKKILFCIAYLFNGLLLLTLFYPLLEFKMN